jgi:hypothetical protein
LAAERARERRAALHAGFRAWARATDPGALALAGAAVALELLVEAHLHEAAGDAAMAAALRAEAAAESKRKGGKS